MDMSTNNQIEQNCFICKKHIGNIIVPGGAIYEDELVYVGHVHWDSEETYLGYVMIDIKRHVPGLAELTDEEAKAFGLITSRVSKALKKAKVQSIFTLLFQEMVYHICICTLFRVIRIHQKSFGHQPR